MRKLGLAAVAVCAVMLQPAAPQGLPDAETRARDYIQFLVFQLDQWTRDFPQAYNMALMRPPVDSASLTESAKAGGVALKDSVERLLTLARANDLPANGEFKSQLDKTLRTAMPVNEALSVQRFPEGLENDWVTIRTTLNSLAAIYKVAELAVLEAPAPGAAKKGGAKVAPEGALTVYVVDQRCALLGKAMWTNVTCVNRCVRDGDKVVLVTEQGKVMQIVNPDKIEAETYGQKVAVVGKTDGDTITIASVSIL